VPSLRGILRAGSEREITDLARRAVSVAVVCVATAFGIFWAVQKPSRLHRHLAFDGRTVSQLSPQRPPSVQFAKLPLSFEVNEGQTDAGVRFISRGGGYSLFLTNNEAVISLKKEPPSRPVAQIKAGFPPWAGVKGKVGAKSEATVVRMGLVGANPAPRTDGIEQLQGKANYFIGNDPKKWQTNVATYAKVKYKNVYPGVDLIYYGSHGQLEYDFVVAPGADPKLIQLKFNTTGKVRLNSRGDLLLFSGDEVRLGRPVVYQEFGGQKRRIDGRFLLASAASVRFRLGEYDHSRPLIIDPTLGFSTYLGGSGADYATGIAVDSNGNSYVTGYTSSANFPVTSGVLQTTENGNYNAFVAVFNSSGSLLYSTYLGGSGNDYAAGIAIGSEHAYIVGSTTSTNFPVLNAFQATNAGGSDVFVTELNPSGSALVYSTYLGGSGNDYGAAITVDPDLNIGLNENNVFITGNTSSTDFPLVNSAISPTGGVVAFMSSLLGTFEAPQLGSSVVFQSSGESYSTSITFNIGGGLNSGPDIAGYTSVTKSECPPSGSACTSASHYEIFIGQGFGGQIINMGGSGDDYAYAIALDSAGGVYLTGATNSTDFPTVNAFQSAYGGGNSDAFVLYLDTNVSPPALYYSTYLGGNGDDYGYAISYDGPAYPFFVAGSTTSTNFFNLNAVQGSNAGGADAFVTEFDYSGVPSLSTYLGGSGNDYAMGVGADSSLNAYITGYTNSTDFPVVNASQSASGGNTDAFIAKILATVPGDITGGFDTFNQRIAAGQSAVYNLTLEPVDGFVGQVDLAAFGLPIGVSVTFSPQVVAVGGTGSSSTAITVTTSSYTNNGTYDIAINLAAFNLAHTTNITLNVGANGDFIGSFSPITASASPTTPASYVLTLTPLEGFNSNVALSASGLPTGAIATFSPTVVTGGSGSSTLSISVTSATPAGNYPITVTGTTPGLSHSTSINLLVGAPDFTGSLTPQYQAVAVGGSAQYTLSLQTIGTMPFNNLVTPSVSGLPAGVTATFSPATINPDTNGSSTLTLTTTSATPQGSYSILVTATGGGQVHASPVTLSVSAPATIGDFSGTFTPIAASTGFGSPAVYNFTLNPLGGFNGSVALSVSNLPPCATATFSPSVIVGGSGGSTLTISPGAGNTTPAGIYAITVTANSGASLVHSTSLTLLVGAVDFTGTITPPSENEVASVAQYTIQLTTVGTQPFGSPVYLYVTQLPPDAVGTFSSPTINPDASGTSVLTIKSGPNTPLGPYTVLVTAKGGGVTHSRYITVNVD